MDEHLVPIQLLPRNDEGKLSLNEEALSKVLEAENVQHREVAVIAAVGAFRKGKSFFLNYLLRFLKHKRRDDWLDDMDAPLTGFHWRGGEERDTEGILLWPEPFLIGDDLVAIVLDTQGVFDNKTVVRDNMVVFAMSTLLSSQLIYNISSQIQLDVLQNLQCFLEYGRMVMEQGETKPFQNLLLLVRDWMHSNNFGFDGGDKQMEKWLKENDVNADKDKASSTIDQCFSQVRCYLMPTPGEDTCMGENKSGALSNCSQKFQNYLIPLVENLLKCNLPRKIIGDKPVIAREFSRYARAYFDSLTRSDVPNPTSIFESTVNTNNTILALEAKQMYVTNMEALCGADTAIEDFDVHQQTYLEEAIKHFDEKRKLGGQEMARNFREKLLEDLESHGKLLKLQNEKRIEREQQVQIEAELQTLFSRSKLDYESAMDLVCDGTSSVPQLDELHETNKQATLGFFRDESEKICSDNDVVQRLIDELKQFLEMKLVRYATVNQQKMTREENEKSVEVARCAAASGFEKYRETMSQLCLSTEIVEDLYGQHEKLKNEVLQVFTTQVSDVAPDSVTPFREKLQKDIDLEFKSFEKQEEQKGEREQLRKAERGFAVSKQAYLDIMNDICGGPVSVASLQDLEKDTRLKVLKDFDKLDVADNLKSTFRIQLSQDFDKMWASFNSSNEKKGAMEAEQKHQHELRVATDQALLTYQTYMDNQTGGEKPINIETLHDEAIAKSEKCFDFIAKHITKENLKVAVEANKTKCIALKKNYKQLNDAKTREQIGKEVKAAIASGQTRYNEFMARVSKADTPVVNITNQHDLALDDAVKCITPLVKKEQFTDISNQLKQICGQEFVKYDERNKVKVQKMISKSLATNLDKYKSHMTKLSQEGTDQLEKEHENAKNTAMKMFQSDVQKYDPENADSHLKEFNRAVHNELSLFTHQNKQRQGQKKSDEISETAQKATNQFFEDLEQASSGPGYVENWNEISRKAFNQAKQVMLDAHPGSQTHAKYQDFIMSLEQISIKFENSNTRKHGEEKKLKKQNMIEKEINHSLHQYELGMHTSFSCMDESEEFENLRQQYTDKVTSELNQNLTEILPEELLEAEKKLKQKIDQSSLNLKHLFESTMKTVVKDGMKARYKSASLCAMQKFNDLMFLSILSSSVAEFKSCFARAKQAAMNVYSNEMEGKEDEDLENNFKKELEEIHNSRWQQISQMLCKKAGEIAYDKYKRDLVAEMRSIDVDYDKTLTDPLHYKHKNKATEAFKNSSEGCHNSAVNEHSNKFEESVRSFYTRITDKISILNVGATEGQTVGDIFSFGISAAVRSGNKTAEWRNFISSLY